MKKKKYPVVYIAFPSHSFQWANGLYIILAKRDGEYKMCHLRNGQAEMIDGRYSVSCTGVGNKGITKTNLSYTGNVYEG